ncbi:MAG TPA: protein kinase [Opitutaceae bacterium]|nr:protein kinase [Opitutaceae bacterium]
MNPSGPEKEKPAGSLSPDAAARAFGFALESSADETSGVWIGHYKLLQKLGEGGFGVVWMAEQQQPIRRRVAVKIIKVGMDTDEVIARFQAERQALALMEHPNIARVIDAGATEAGRPFFVMELVRGVAITRYCDENKLSAEARLRLFISVCQAVQHAHQKGVIHRDLKPSNILVTLHDGVPVPKIIDFGIAKATSARLTEKTLFTQFHAFIGTPAYTSPEQMEMSGLDVDTRSDIYSLGVLLYELLTGQPPFDSDALVKSGLEAMRRTIREIDPPRPSHRLGTLTEVNRSSVASHRGTDPTQLSLLLRGDLDWIAMRCLEKDRTRRYDSATALAADVERHLNDDLVEARPPSRIYRAKKFIRRHKLAVGAAAAITASLLAGLIVSSGLFVRERSAHNRAMLAEQKETELRHQAEIAREAEVKRAARTALDLANRNLADGRVADGLAYLVYAAKKDPLNPTLGPRLASAMAAQSFLLPEGEPFECGSRVVAMRYTLDGRTFMAGTEDGTMRLFDTATGKLLREFRLGKRVMANRGWLFPRDNDRVFAARFTDNSLGVFDAAEGRSAVTIQLDRSVRPTVEAVRFSPDGRWIGGCGTRDFWLWDAGSGEQKIDHPLEAGQDFDFSADGRFLSVVADDVVNIWTLPGLTRPIEAIAVTRPRPHLRYNIALFARFLPDGRRLAIIDPHIGIRHYDLTTGGPLGPLIATEGGFQNNAWEFLPDGRLLQSGSKLWDLDTNRFTQLPLPSRGDNWERHLNRSGSLLLTTSNDEGVHLWDTRTGKPAALFTLQLETSIRGALHPDDRHIVIGTAEGTIQRLRASRGAAEPLVLPRNLPAMPVLFLPEPPARLLWLQPDRARVLDVASGRDLGGFAFPRTLTQSAPGEGSTKSSLRDDLKFFVVRNGPAWEAWELSPRGVINVVPLRDDPPDDQAVTVPVTFSATGDLVALTVGSTIRVWDLRTGASVGAPMVKDSPFWFLCVNFSPDGRQLGASPAVWNIASGQPVPGLFDARNISPFIVQFSPDGTQLITAEREGAARLWNVATGAPASPELRHADTLFSANFSPDGRYFATRSLSEVRLWNAKTAALVGRPIPLANGRSLRFSADSRRFVTASEDGVARIFDVRNAQAFIEPLQHPGTRLPMGFFSPDALFVRMDTTAPDIRIWSVPPALPDGMPPPAWLLRLATFCAGAAVDDSGQLVAKASSAAAIEELRTELAALPPDAPLADWGRWILNNRADRSIAPGFTVTPAEAAQLTSRLATQPDGAKP